MMKVCSRCQRLLPDEEFYRNRRMKSGLNSTCIPCAVERTREWRKEHPEYGALYNLRRRVERREDRMCSECGEQLEGRPNKIVCSLRCAYKRQYRINIDMYREKNKRRRQITKASREGGTAE